MAVDSLIFSVIDFGQSEKVEKLECSQFQSCPFPFFSDGLQQHINGRLVPLCKVFVKSKKTFNTGMMTLESKILHLAFSSPAAASPPPAVQHLNFASPAISSPSPCKVDHLAPVSYPRISTKCGTRGNCVSKPASVESLLWEGGIVFHLRKGSAQFTTLTEAASIKSSEN